MAPSKEHAVHAINKRRPRRIILQTLPPVVLSTPTNAITVRFTMSTAATAGLKSIVPVATSELHSLVPRPVPQFVAAPTETSAQTPPSAGDAILRKHPSGRTVDSKDRADQPVGGVSEEELQQAIDRLENRIEQECALVRQELRWELRQDFRREVARLDHRLDALDKSMTIQFSSVLSSLHGLHTSINGLATRIDGLATRPDGLIARIDNFEKTMNMWFDRLDDQLQTILDLLQQCQKYASNQPVPMVVARAPSSDSHDTVRYDVFSSPCDVALTVYRTMSRVLPLVAAVHPSLPS